MTPVDTPKVGLEGVVATSSAICHIDGERGVLAYAGHDIHDLAREAAFEEVCYLLWHRRLPSRAELGDLRSELAAARRLPEAMLRLMRSLPAGHAMDALRTLVSALAHSDPEADDQSPPAAYRKAVRLTAQVGSVVATWGRLNAGGGPIEPDPALGHAANFLLLLTGERPSALEAQALDVALILHADHELNASTFAARVTAATLSDVHSAAVAGIGALKGPLHGGANAEVMRMLLAIGEDADDARVERTVRDMLARKTKVPGFGHRVYRTEDPRATHLRRMSREVGERSGSTRWYEMSRRIEAVMKAETSIDANVDFYLGVDVLHARNSHRAVHAGLRRQPDRRLDRPRARAVREQPAHPAARRVRRAGVSAAVHAARPALTGPGPDRRPGSRRGPLYNQETRCAAPGATRRSRCITARSAISPSSRTSITGSRPSRIAFSRSRVRCGLARWRSRSSIRWIWSGSGASPSRPMPYACPTRRTTASPTY